MTLELDDIQHILLTRTPAMTGRYEFLSFDTPAGGRAWLSELLDRMQSAAEVRDTMDRSKRWITLAFTWTGLRALGVSENALATFPDEFREGMAARADILGDAGANAPEHWVGGWPETTCMPLRSCSPVTMTNTGGARANTTSWWRAARGCAHCRSST